MNCWKAHNLDEKDRSEDVCIYENVTFEDMYLPVHVLNGLLGAGFIRPSPIQLSAIPLGRCGLDLIVQAKSGTGKTCVFTVIALESVNVASTVTQVLVLAPTREIAVQITQVISLIGSKLEGLKVATFIGGLSVAEDKIKLKCCHIAVGTPGRVLQLVELGLLKLKHIRLFVLDEADQLLSGQFSKSILRLTSSLPLNKQFIATSATYTQEVSDIAAKLMRNPSFVHLSKEYPALLGVDQYVINLPYYLSPHQRHKCKFKKLFELISCISFNQCLVFFNSQMRAESTANELTKSGWPVAFLAGCQNQTDRLKSLHDFCNYKCRILVSTDLSARGLDSEHVNLVINVDVPRDHATYLHRVGRAGRFGSKGSAITLATEGDELIAVKAISTNANMNIYCLPNKWKSSFSDLKLSGDVKLLKALTQAELTVFNKKRSVRQQVINKNRHCNDGSKETLNLHGKLFNEESIDLESLAVSVGQQVIAVQNKYPSINFSFNEFYKELEQGLNAQNRDSNINNKNNEISFNFQIINNYIVGYNSELQKMVLNVNKNLDNRNINIRDNLDMLIKKVDSLKNNLIKEISIEDSTFMKDSSDEFEANNIINGKADEHKEATHMNNRKCFPLSNFAEEEIGSNLFIGLHPSPGPSDIAFYENYKENVIENKKSKHLSRNYFSDEKKSRVYDKSRSNDHSTSVPKIRKKKGLCDTGFNYSEYRETSLYTDSYNLFALNSNVFMNNAQKFSTMLSYVNSLGKLSSEFAMRCNAMKKDK